MSRVLRIVDVNANRAREALRVMEDAARFVLGDAGLTEELKQLRHDLSRATAAVAGLAASRDTPGDVGTGITTAGEATRASVAEVAMAAGLRLTEALRSVEEYGKLLPQHGGAAGFAGRVEALRYRAYDAQQRLDRAMAPAGLRQWRLCVLVSESLCRRPWMEVARAAVEGGADCLQLREKSLEGGWLVRRASELVAMARPRGVSVIVNDRADVALLAGADGVHLGQDDLPAERVRQVVGGQLLVGVSTANLEQARRAVQAGADYCGVGPMFPTTTKHKEVIVGPGYAGAFARAYPAVPHLAIGGVTAENVGQVIAAGGRGVAVSGAVCAAEDPRAATRAIVAAIEAALQDAGQAAGLA